jgi:hypothetical protein
MLMARKNTPGGILLETIGVDTQKFSSQKLTKDHFDKISTPQSCKLIEAIGTEEGDYNSAFDLVLNTLKSNEKTFNTLCNQVENISNRGADAAYQIIDDNANDTNILHEYDPDRDDDFLPLDDTVRYTNDPPRSSIIPNISGNFLNLPNNFDIIRINITPTDTDLTGNNEGNNDEN